MAQLSGNWSAGPIVPALANAPDLSTLRAFPGPVLLPPALPPFADLPLAPPFPGLPQGPTADTSYYRVRLGSSRLPGGNWEVGATLGQGLLGGETNCAPSASYCDSPRQESFRGLQVNGDSAVVIHSVGPDGESNLWSVGWFDEGAGATYFLGIGSEVTAADASAYPRGKSPAHVSAAQKLPSLAAKLVLWVPDNQQDNSAGAPPPSPGAQMTFCEGVPGDAQSRANCDDGTGYLFDFAPGTVTVALYDPANPNGGATDGPWAITEVDGLNRWTDPVNDRSCYYEFPTAARGRIEVGCTPRS
jgi:hypothetical protein